MIIPEEDAGAVKARLRGIIGSAAAAHEGITSAVRRIPMKRGAWIAASCLAGLISSQPAQAADPVKGNALAVKFCARCHVIDHKNPFGGIGSSPSFPLMAKNAEMFRPRIRTFHERRPHAQFLWDVSNADIADLEAYIMSLAEE